MRASAAAPASKFRRARRPDYIADLETFLDEDNAFRIETGAVPSEFEVALPAGEVGGVEMRGVVDRIDRSPDGRRAWVIDYKTGSSSTYKDLAPDDPFLGGTKLQLPAYAVAAGAAEEVRALYWFISRKGEFRRIPYAPTAQNQRGFAETVTAIVEGVRAGAFPAVPGEENESTETGTTASTATSIGCARGT